MDRREFLCSASMVGLGVALAGSASGQAPSTLEVGRVHKRVSWQTFVKTPSYASFVKAVRAMRAIPDDKNPNSWFYWANVHENFCKHMEPYFFAWHRGYLVLFEAKLKEITGDSQFRLPYWDYYTDSRIPKEFLDPGSPLYVSRESTDVGPALPTDAFDAEFVDFQRGSPLSYEARLESKPHNRVHNLIGNDMAEMQSPRDPIFWLHHANIDRLWCAWLAAGQCRRQPHQDDTYWDVRFQYADNLYVDGQRTTGTLGFGYEYDDLRLPKPLLASSSGPESKWRVQRLGESATNAAAGILGAGRLVLGNENLRLEAPLPAKLSAGPAHQGRNTVTVTLHAPAVTDEGRTGGYFYRVYVVLEGREREFVGNLGAFEIATLSHAHHRDHAGHGNAGAPQISYTLKFDGPSPKVQVELERVNAVGVAKGEVITLDNVTVEVTSAGP